MTNALSTAFLNTRAGLVCAQGNILPQPQEADPNHHLCQALQPGESVITAVSFSEQEYIIQDTTLTRTLLFVVVGGEHHGHTASYDFEDWQQHAVVQNLGGKATHTLEAIEKLVGSFSYTARLELDENEQDGMSYFVEKFGIRGERIEPTPFALYKIFV